LIVFWEMNVMEDIHEARLSYLTGKYKYHQHIITSVEVLFPSFSRYRVYLGYIFMDVLQREQKKEAENRSTFLPRFEITTNYTSKPFTTLVSAVIPLPATIDNSH
jgi:hypothetical protein